MITRKIGKILRGKATPLQIWMACILGSMIGFVPGFAQGPGLMVALVLLLIVLNANLGIAALVGISAKLVSLALMPVSFHIGRVLLDGPTQPLFKAMINAPVLALFGFESYATMGGIVLGLLFGSACAIALIQAVQRFRRKMVSLEEGSEAFRKFMSRRPVRILMFIFVGGSKGKRSYEEILSKKLGNPVRPAGVVLCVLVLALLLVARQFLTEPILTAQLVRALERTNGATVDLESAQLDLDEGRLTLVNLAMADPGAPETDVFRAQLVEADVSGADLLTKRIALDSLVVSEASSGEARATPGVIVGDRPRPARAPATAQDEKTIDDYIAEAGKWKQRLAQARRWLDRVGRSDAGGDATPEAQRESLRERLAREVRQKGYARVRASHLIDGAPTLLVRELRADGVRVAQVEGEVLDISGQNLSTHPHLVEGETGLAVRSRSNRIQCDLGLGAPAAGGTGVLRVIYNGIDADRVGQQLTVMGDPPIRGGTIDLAIDGTWSPQGVGYIDLPMQVTLHNTTLTLPRSGQSADVSLFVLPIGLRGPMDNPAIRIDDQTLADALVRSGASQLADRAGAEAKKALDSALGDEAKGVADQAGKALGNLLGGDKKK